MAVAIIGGASAASKDVSTLDTGSIAVTSDSNRCLVVLVQWNIGLGASVSSVVWDPSGSAQSCTQFGSTISVGNRRAQIWRLLAPTATTAVVRVTWSDATAGSQGVQAAAFSGVDQTTPLADQASNTTAGTSSSITVANVTSEDMVIDGLMAGTLSLTAGADQTVIGSIGLPADIHGGSRQAGSAGGVMSWALSPSAALCHTACRIVAAASGGGATGSRRRPTRLLLGVS